MSKIVVTYPVVVEKEITKAEYDLVYSLYNPSDGYTPMKIVAVRFIRQQYSLGLKEAKDICDAIGGNEKRTF